MPLSMTAEAFQFSWIQRTRRSLSEQQAKANAAHARIRSGVEHVFAAQKYRIAFFVRTIGVARAQVKIGMANLAYNFSRLARLSTRTAPA